MSRAPVELHLRIRIAANRREEFLAFLREAIPFYERPGGIHVRLLQETADPTRMIELVEYAGEEEYRQDQSRVEHDPEMQAFLACWRELLDGPPDVEVYRPLAVGAGSL